MAPAGTILGVAAKATFVSRAATASSGVLASFRRGGGLTGQRLVGLLLEPLRPVGGLGGEEFLQVDRGRCAVRLRGLDGDRAALRPLQG